MIDENRVRVRQDLIKIEEIDGKAVVTSRIIAEKLEKQHKDVVRKIRDTLAERDYTQRDYLYGNNNKAIEYILDKDAFILLVMNYEGHNDFKRSYIKRFTEMEKELKQFEVAIPKMDSHFLLKMSQHMAELEKANAIQEKEIFNQTEIITGLTENITILDKRNIINRVARKGSRIANRYTELYKVFRETYKVDLVRRCQGYNNQLEKSSLKLSVIAYAEQFGFIPDLYDAMCKLYEADIQETLRYLGFTINDNQAWKTRSEEENEEILLGDYIFG